MPGTVKDAILRGRKTVETVVEEGRKKVEDVVEGGLNTVETVVEAGLNTVETRRRSKAAGRSKLPSAWAARPSSTHFSTGAAPCRPPSSMAAKMFASRACPFPEPRPANSSSRLALPSPAAPISRSSAAATTRA